MTPSGSERVLGSYTLGEQIGQGATGQVFRGRDSAGDPVAVKLLRPEYGSDPVLVSRCVQEAHVLTGLRHPNLVAVRDLVAEGGRLAIVMDLVEGAELRQVLTAEGALPRQARERAAGQRRRPRGAAGL
jgi:serine/threonine protein kinase